MPKFYVTLIETVHYDIEVEAATEESADHLAREMWCTSADPTHDFCGDSQGCETLNVEQATEESPATHYAFTADSCPSKHWNDGTDICRDCGVNLN